MKKFSLVKYVLDCKKRGISDDLIVESIDSWVLEAHGKSIFIDEFGNHCIDGTGYLSVNDWEEEMGGNENEEI